MDLRDPQVFCSVYERHVQRVRAAANRVLGDHAQADEAAQDVFLRLWRNPDRFDAARGELGAYLCLMARSRALDLWRSNQAHARAGERLAIVESAEPAEEGPGAALERVGLRAELKRALRDLPPAQREALVLSFWGDMSAREIARREGVPLATVRSRLRLGLEKLRAGSAVERSAA